MPGPVQGGEGAAQEKEVPEGAGADEQDAQRRS